MKKLIVATIFLGACAPNQEPTLESVALARDLYSWSCKDYDDHTEIIVETATCEDIDSGLHYLIAEYTLYNGPGYKTHLTEVNACEWSASFFLIDEVCISVEGVSLVALVEEPSWEGAFSDD